MRRFELRVVEDVLGTGRTTSLAAANRIVYVVDGWARITAAAGGGDLGENQAWHGATDCVVAAAGDAVRVWRWELVPREAANDSASGSGRVMLAREIDLDPGAAYLLRCDRVDFPPGGIAYTHTHRGPGIRVLLTGTFRVETGGHVLDLRAGQPWFESGPEPVYAAASDVEPAGFVRVMVLPVELLGKSSIRYVKPEDQDTPKSQRYTVFVDTPLSL